MNRNKDNNFDLILNCLKDDYNNRERNFESYPNKIEKNIKSVIPIGKTWLLITVLVVSRCKVLVISWVVTVGALDLFCNENEKDISWFLIVDRVRTN